MLTVVIPSYNHQAYIQDCLDSVCQIDVENIKILVIDDGSTDNTVKVVKKFIEENRDIDIELIQKKNAGLVSSLNLSVTLVETEFFYVCASDDIPVPAGIKYCLETLIEEENCYFVIGGAKSFCDDEGQSIVYGESQRYFLGLPPCQRDRKLFFNYPSPILLQSSVFRTEAIKNIGGWDSDLILDDYPFFIKLLRHYSRCGLDFKYLPGVYNVLYRQHQYNSYRNTLRQYHLVSQVINKYAPDKIRSGANANCAAGYMLTAIKYRNFNDCVSIFLQNKFGVKIKLPYYMLKQVLAKIYKLA